MLPDGQPNPAVTIGRKKDNATVWETGKESYEIATVGFVGLHRYSNLNPSGEI